MLQALQCVKHGAEAVVLGMVEAGWSAAALDTLPVGVALPLREAAQRCRHAPPGGERNLIVLSDVARSCFRTILTS